MNAPDMKLTVWGMVLALVFVCGALALNLFRQAHGTADDSAHAALTAEICERLASPPLGQRYPDSLSRLPLTYPDGGSTSLLSRFSYHCTGTNCTVRTVLNGNDFVRSFP